MPLEVAPCRCGELKPIGPTPETQSTQRAPGVCAAAGPAFGLGIVVADVVAAAHELPAAIAHGFVAKALPEEGFVRGVVEKGAAVHGGAVKTNRSI